MKPRGGVGLLVDGAQVVPGRPVVASRTDFGWQPPNAGKPPCKKSMAKLWRSQLNRTYECVIALIDGDQSQQSWDSMARVWLWPRHW